MRLSRMLAILVITTLPVVAEAECAWVLWVRGQASQEAWQRQSVSAAMMAVWQTQSAYGTKAQCEAATANKGPIKQALLTEHRLEDPAMKLFVQCLPDTVDARGPNGSGR